jgi:ribosomal protein S18 acetylase RimI-like enzyme
MRVREMSRADLPSVRDLSGQLGYPLTDEDLARRFTLLAADTNHRLLVAEDDSARVVGWVHLGPHLALESEPYAEICGLVVDGRARRLGVGRELVREAEKAARALGFATIRVRSNVARNESHSFYMAIGYARLKTQHCYERAL